MIKISYRAIYISKEIYQALRKKSLRQLPAGNISKLPEKVYKNLPARNTILVTQIYGDSVC